MGDSIIKQKCHVSDCINTKRTKGYCDKHYKRYRLYGNPLLIAKRKNLGNPKHPLYKTYHSMKNRCKGTGGKGSYKYVEKGIKVCDRWLGDEGFNNFVKDMGDKPSSEYSLDRIDNDGDYTPENCRWATPQTQACNQSMQKNNTSGFTGVSYHKRTNKWVAYYYRNKKLHHLGYFPNADSAYQARLLNIN